MRGATGWSDLKSTASRNFNPRSSCEERPCLLRQVLWQLNFNPRSSCEERHASVARSGATASNFNPRSSCEERRHRGTTAPRAVQFQSTLLMRGATDVSKDDMTVFRISIHAPHARSDIGIAADGVGRKVFQSTLLMRGATSCWTRSLYLSGFQSTLLMRGATWHDDFDISDLEFQSTLLMRGATLPAKDYQGRPIQFQSTLLMRGATCMSTTLTMMATCTFQSTLLMRGATYRRAN